MNPGNERNASYFFFVFKGSSEPYDKRYIYSLTEGDTISLVDCVI